MTLEVHELYAGYGHLQILNGVDLRAATDKITVILGPNGAGKSTLLKAVYGFIVPTRGQVRFNEESLVGVPPHRMLSKGIPYVQQGRSVFPYLTVEENLAMGAYTVRDRARLRLGFERVYATFPILQLRRRQLAGSMSGGERRFLELARVLMVDPKLVLLDEPSIGVAPKLMGEIYEQITALNAVGVGFLIVEQNVRQALRAADYVYLLESGVTRWSGTPSDLANTDTLRRLYLGSSVDAAGPRA